MMWLLIPAGAAAATFALLVFELLSNKRLIQRDTQRLWANLFSIRLFADNPRCVLQSLGQVIVLNCKLLLYALPPLCVIAPIFFLAYGYMDAAFGASPLQVGAPQVLTVRLNHIDDSWPQIRLDAPDWVSVDSPPVHVLDQQEISWRIQPLKASQGSINIIMDGQSAAKLIDSRPQSSYFSSVRMQSWLEWLRYPAEPRLPPGNIREISLSGVATSTDWSVPFTLIMFLFAIPVKYFFFKR